MLMISFSAFGQETKVEWQTFSPAAEEFALETPTAFTPITLLSPTRESKYRSYSAFFDNTYYFAFSDDPQDARQNKVALDFIGNYAGNGRDKEIFVYSDAFGYHHRILTLKTKKRVYTFQTVSKNAINPSVDKFFAGIKIGGEAPKLMERIAVTAIPQAEIKPADDQNAGIGTGSGTGGGSLSSGSGTGTGSSPTPKTTGETARTVITSKPRANYTDYARFYQITGAVRVRVTFLANGKLGTVTPVSELPFGLTQEAIKAAKSITFKPAIKNGVPVATTMIVEYVFVLF